MAIRRAQDDDAHNHVPDPSWRSIEQLRAGLDGPVPSSSRPGDVDRSGEWSVTRDAGESHDAYVERVRESRRAAVANRELHIALHGSDGLPSILSVEGSSEVPAWRERKRRDGLPSADLAGRRPYIETPDELRNLLLGELSGTKVAVSDELLSAATRVLHRLRVVDSVLAEAVEDTEGMPASLLPSSIMNLIMPIDGRSSSDFE